MHIGYIIAVSVVATAFVVGIAGRVEAALAQADKRNSIIPQPDLTGLYQVGKASDNFQDPSLKKVYTTEPNSKRSLITKVWHPKIWHPRQAVPGGSSASKNLVK